jgi:hypothetical protein
MSRRRLVRALFVLLVIVLPVSPLLIPRSGAGWQPLRHRYDTYRACNELMLKTKPDAGGGGPILPLRWWHLLGWRGRLDDSGSGVTFTWDWWSSMDTAGGRLRVYALCTVESGRRPMPGQSLDVDSSGDWSLVQGMQTPVGASGMPIHSFGDLCAEHSERCK